MSLADVRRWEAVVDLHALYPDLDRERRLPPSVLGQHALSLASRGVPRWRPDPTEPSDTLAVIGALVLSAAVRTPMSWDGEQLRGRCPIGLIRRTRLQSHTVKQRERLELWVRDDRDLLALSLPAHEASRLWAGRVTLEMIWDRAQEALGELARPRAVEEGEVDLGSSTLSLVTASGYDARIVGIAERDGFSIAAHDDIEIVGGRPGVELYALIGAAWLEHWGRWPRPSQPQIPAIGGVPLRDRLDLDRLLIVGAVLPVRHGLSGRRGYLEAAS